MDMIVIDGSEGEGGGQMLRTALSLSMVTGRPFRIEKLRAKRSRPGLLRQHLTAVQAAAAVCGARVEGDTLGTTVLAFSPGTIRGGDHHLRIGSAGSATLVLQTVLPALLRAPKASTVVVEGGTHNPLAPTVDFLDRAFLPLLRRMGVEATITLGRHGFYPAGGGRVTLAVAPAPKRLTPLSLLERGAEIERRATVLLAALPFEVARRELAVLAEQLSLPEERCRPLMVPDPIGPGNVVLVEVQSEHVTEVFSAVGEKGVAAEVVAARAAAETLEYLAADVPVGPHLADQLLLPLALGGGAFRTLAPTLHTRTQVVMIERFIDRRVAHHVLPDGSHRFEIASAP